MNGKSSSSDPADERGPDYGTNVSGSQVGSMAQGDHARAVTIVHHHHGLSYSDTKDLFLLLWKQNFPKLATAARAEARRRVGGFAETFARVAGEQHLKEEQLAGLADPDAQFVLNAAIQNSARRDDANLRNVLAALIVRRLQRQERELENLALGEAVLATSKLTSVHLHILALNYLTMYADWFNGPVTWDACNAFLETMVRPLLPVKMCYGDILHIDYAGCAVLAGGPVRRFGAVIVGRYEPLFGELPRDGSRDEFVSTVIARESAILKELCDLSERTRFYTPRLTTVGVTLAVIVIEQMTGKRLLIDKWLG